MPSVHHRPRIALMLASGAALALAGCVPLPPALPPTLPTAEPPVTVEPTRPAPTLPDPVPPGSGPDPGESELPPVVEVGARLEPGTLPGWETSILSDSAFAAQPDSDFPAGPTISVVEVATGCTFWAYQGAPDSTSTDELESTEATLASVTGTSPDEWDADEFELAPSASQGVSVVFLSLYRDLDDGSTEAWFARNFQSSGTTSSIRATCGPDAGGIEHIDDTVLEHFQINFLLP